MHGSIELKAAFDCPRMVNMLEGSALDVHLEELKLNLALSGQILDRESSCNTTRIIRTSR